MSIADIKMKARIERSRNLRYKRPALAELGYETIMSRLQEISDECADVSMTIYDDDTLLDALDGDEEAVWDFRFAFAELNANAETLIDEFYNFDSEDFDYCSVALIGNRFNMVGYDDYEEDYFSLCQYDERLAYEEAGRRVMRRTKQEMLIEIGHTLGCILAFQNVEYKYMYLKATIDVLRDENHSILDAIKDIEKAYEAEDWKHLDRLLLNIPDRIWVG